MVPIIDRLALSPRGLQRLHGWLTIGWVAVIPFSIVTGWIYSIAFISGCSIYANASGHFSAWQAARTEVKQDEG